MKQIAVSFYCGVNNGVYNTTPVEEQINQYLKDHPNYYGKSITMAVVAPYKEALVLFDIRDEDNKTQKPKENKKYG